LFFLYWFYYIYFVLDHFLEFLLHNFIILEFFISNLIIILFIVIRLGLERSPEFAWFFFFFKAYVFLVSIIFLEFCFVNFYNMLSMWLVSGSLPESLVSKLDTGWLFFFKIDLFQFYSPTFYLLKIGLCTFYFSFLSIRLSRSSVYSCRVKRLNRVDSYFFLLLF
jgi:hypothetical protein